MQYLIEGADKATGEDRTIIVEADNEADLRAKIAEMGILVSQSRPWQSPTPPAAPSPVEYSSVRKTVAAPSYFGLQIASFILGVSALLFYALAVILVAVTISESTNNLHNSPLAMTGGMVAEGTAILTLFAAGGIQHGLSAGCVALRDIARNSFGK